MSNPCLNRWGSSIYWSVFWYSDNYYAKNLQQDRIFEKLLNIYLFYGLQTKTTFFLSTYWFYSNSLNTTNSSKSLITSPNNYYRWFEYFDSGLGKKFKDCLRTKTNDVYMMKLWILKFVNWIVINVYWFKPIKGKESPNRYQLKARPSFDYTFLYLGRKINSTNIHRLKVLTSQHFFKLLSKKLYYKF